MTSPTKHHVHSIGDLTHGPQKGDGKVPTATPYLVLPALPADTGARPLPLAEAYYSRAVQLLDANGHAVVHAMPGKTFTVTATIENVGPAACYAGIATFFRAAPGDLDTAARTGTAPGPAFARTSFTCAPGGTTTVTAGTWTPATPLEAMSSILVHAIDLLSDPLVRPFDPVADRHVARRDVIPDFAGHWRGAFTTNWASQRGTSFAFEVDIVQTGLQLDCSFFEQVGGPGHLPSTPQEKGQGQVTGLTAGLTTTTQGAPHAQTTWTLKLTAPDVLHVFGMKKYPPTDGRPPQQLQGDLHRV